MNNKHETDFKCIWIASQNYERKYGLVHILIGLVDMSTLTYQIVNVDDNLLK